MTEPATRKQLHHFAHPLLRARDWQERPEFAQLCDWWRQIGKGVCSLVGIGGAGKTAIVERFLRMLPGVLPLELGIRKQESLPKPRRLFVFSFYDAPNPEDFFTQLANWLTNANNRLETTAHSYEQIVRLLECAGPCLLILDGLEKVQEDGLRGTPFGQISDGRLRNLVLRAAENCLADAAMLITTRFAIDDLRERPGLNYREVPIEQISVEGCVALLRRRGVRGSDLELSQIAQDCGYHALTVDLAGGYIANFAEGDPGARMGWSMEETQVARSFPTPNDRLNAVAEQTARFERLAVRYRQALARTDRAALALLERVCLFRLGVDAELLTLIFTGPEKDDLSGPELAALSPEEVRARMDKLVAMRLLEATEQGTHLRQQATAVAPTVFSGVRDTTYTVHPAVRDGFLKGLDADNARRGHDAAREGLVESLGGLPGRGTNPSDARTLDRLEEIVYHTLQAGRPDTAWEIYLYQIGGYENLGRRLGAYERGERICRAFTADQAAEDVHRRDRLHASTAALVLDEYALYLSDVGQLDAAARCYQQNIAMRVERESWKNASIGNQNLTDVLLVAGRLSDALNAAEEAVRLAERASYAFERKDSYAYRGYTRALRGETTEALADFATALHWQRSDERASQPLYRMRGVQLAWLLARLGRTDEAARVTEANKALLRRTLGNQHHYLPRCDLLLAGLARASGDLSRARELQHQAEEWAVARDAREQLCGAIWERGSIALADARRKADGPFGPETSRCLHDARQAAEEGLRLARECGFGIFHIELLLLRASLALEVGDATSAITDARTALERGDVPPAVSGRPPLFAAGQSECGYAWGVGLAHHLLAEAFLLQAAQRLGRADCTVSHPPSAIREILDAASIQMALSREARKRIQDPALNETERLFRDVMAGVLTRFPLQQRSN
jgi:tetratricopeptide (TPR) repeat protein